MTDHCIFITNEHSGLCGVTLLCKKFSKILNSSFPGSARVFAINFSRPCQALRTICLLTNEVKRSGSVHYIFNYPLPGHCSKLFYPLLVSLFSLKYKTSVFYHGYFHVAPFHSFSAILLLSPFVSCRYYVTKDFLQRMHPFWRIVYKTLLIRNLPVLPLLDTYDLEPTLQVEIPILSPSSHKVLSLEALASSNYLLYYGIPSPQKRIPLAYLIAQSLKLPLIVCSTDIHHVESLLASPLSHYPGLILVSPPSDSTMTYLIAHATATINIPTGELGDWSSTWLATRAIGTLVISCSSTNPGYDPFVHTYFLDDEINDIFIAPSSLTSILGSKKPTYQTEVNPSFLLSQLSIS